MRTSALAAIMAAFILPAGMLAAQDEPAAKTARAVIDAPVEPNTTLARAELNRLINELQSISFRDPANPVARGPVAKTATSRKGWQQVATADANSAATKAAERPEPAVKPKPEVPAIAGDPNTLADPFEMAEALYKMGRYKESAACYGVALARASSTEKSNVPEADRAWMLFQRGNCHARLDAREAIKIYRQLITEHPASEWAPIAIGREQLLQWYITSDIAMTPEKR
jgi:tetratricopeptide (TPR) repeat protein